MTLLDHLPHPHHGHNNHNGHHNHSHGAKDSLANKPGSSPEEEETERQESVEKAGGDSASPLLSCSQFQHRHLGQSLSNASEVSVGSASNQIQVPGHKVLERNRVSKDKNSAGDVI